MKRTCVFVLALAWLGKTQLGFSLHVCMSVFLPHILLLDLLRRNRQTLKCEEILLILLFRVCFVFEQTQSICLQIIKTAFFSPKYMSLSFVTSN